MTDITKRLLAPSSDDLLARLAQRPQSREGYIDWELDRAEFDRALLLDAWDAYNQGEPRGSSHALRWSRVATAIDTLRAVQSGEAGRHD